MSLWTLCFTRHKMFFDMGENRGGNESGSNVINVLKHLKPIVYIPYKIIKKKYKKYPKWVTLGQGICHRLVKKLFFPLLRTAKEKTVKLKTRLNMTIPFQKLTFSTFLSTGLDPDLWTEVTSSCIQHKQLLTAPPPSFSVVSMEREHFNNEYEKTCSVIPQWSQPRSG